MWFQFRLKLQSEIPVWKAVNEQDVSGDMRVV
jgi:hypothetical protein